jgi:anti-sigma factor RsiW
MNVKWLWNQCARYEQGLSLLAAGILPEADRPAVEAHLAECFACRRRLEETRRLASGLATLAQNLPQSRPSLSLRSRWKQAVLQEEHGEPAPSATFWPFDLPWRFIGGRVAWGAAAACWVLILGLRVTAPGAVRPAVPSPPVSWREVVLALQKPLSPRLKVETTADAPRRGQPAWPAPAPRSGRTTEAGLA